MKLLDIILKQFWHPAMEKVIRDICKSCIHCQTFKTSCQNIYPPTIKITTSYPFELVSMDLMMLPKTPDNNIAVVVAIDHYSEWLSVIPIRDKKSRTVAMMLRDRILPNLPKLPTKILTDNGPEFRADEFNQVLNDFDIAHVYRTHIRLHQMVELNAQIGP